MTYVGLNSAEECIQRVMNRAHRGGHSAPAELIRLSYAASIQNLGEAFKWFSRVHVYDNSAFNQPPRLVAICAERTIYADSHRRPIWVSAAIAAYNRLR
jgi:predicted ABC-type ATPase